MFIILVYDVKEERVAKALKICRKYLTWVQNSVFEGEITEAKLRMLKDELKGVMDETYDSVIIYKFRTKQYYERETLGIEKPSHEDFIV
ncbi:MAG: CRISPR-associated endonuclease Cas2 [Hydrogenobacter thermophilus]|uniref:CRISPR-associated endonuclease Cas2 n=1 Tax=Hydrogenobacter thermophilus TaxID=940 RepID=UPI001C79575F|nr:CRISPR-associated endonuclease Cas2 [Hydrogenobacter thermophilus]MCS7284569.1 CRISPR-associated endonuclease Cas2 [Hydrogenobacter thermophilus]QWK20549.1 MAG: CRISPR-associated endonuclease Cas2 [Hydrogenobacter thermophilus]